MREILFRGKRVDNGEWIYGDVIQFPMHGIVRIIEQNSDNDGSYGDSEIDCDTLGQFTGLTDKNGKKIFEGDIVKITGFHTTAIAAVKYGSASEKSTHWGWYFDDNDGHTYFLMSKAFCKDYNAIIIGNIHDNPELLEVTK